MRFLAPAVAALMLLSIGAEAASFSAGRSFSTPARSSSFSAGRSFSAPRPSTPAPSVTPSRPVAPPPAYSPPPSVNQRTTVNTTVIQHSVAPAGGGFMSTFMASMGGSFLGNWLAGLFHHDDPQRQQEAPKQ